MSRHKARPSKAQKRVWRAEKRNEWREWAEKPAQASWNFCIDLDGTVHVLAPAVDSYRLPELP